MMSTFHYIMKTMMVCYSMTSVKFPKPKGTELTAFLVLLSTMYTTVFPQKENICDCTLSSVQKTKIFNADCSFCLNFMYFVFFSLHTEVLFEIITQLTGL